MKTVVLVDDEQRMLDLLELYITPHGYRCMKIKSGYEAIQFLRNKHAIKPSQYSNDNCQDGTG